MTDFLTFDRDELSSKTSYIVKLPLVDLVRILCTDQELSCKHDIADDSEILNVQLNHSLLHDNVRGYLGETNYNRNIITSLKTQQSDFFMYNNGVTIVTNRVFAESKNSGKKYFFNIEDFQVVNGGQTIKSIFKFLSEINTSTTDQKLREIFVLVRIFNIENDELKNNIAEYTNSQNAISSSDLKSVDNIQIQIESYLKLNSILYVRKAGSLGDDSTTYEYRISKDKLAQIIRSEQGYPDRVTNQKQKLFSDYYKQIFPEVFDFDKMLSLINLFRNIEETLQKESKDYTDLRAYYILYIIGKVQCSIDEANDILNQAVSKQRQTKKASSISVPRLMIQKSFREQVAELMGNEFINEGTTCDPLSAI